jgi:outer membrane protein assembly factor BamB
MKRLIMTSVILTLITATALAVDWPRWRGPAANGVIANAVWKPESLATSKVLWRANVGNGHSAVTIQGDRAYTMGTSETKAGGETSYQEVVFCLDANTGKEIWRYAYPCLRRQWPGPGSTPVLDGGFLYVMARGGEVFCFDAKDGRVIWKRHLVQDGLAQEPNWGFCASPAVDGNLVLLNAGRSGVALDKKTGKVVWASEPELGWLATPQIFDLKGTRVAAISARGTMYVVKVADGTVVWSHPWQSDSDPTLVGSTLHLTGGGRGSGNVLIDLADKEPKVAWESRALSGAFQTGVVINGHAYGLGRDRRDNALQCVDLASGEVKWSQRLVDWGSLIAVEDMLLLIEGDGDLVIAEASPAAYRQLAAIKLFNLRTWQSYPDGNPNTCWTAPAFANGKVYVRTTYGDLACVDLRG